MHELPNKFGVVILAAGASRRMGKPKMLLPWRDTSVLGHLIRQWYRLGAAQIAVVCADEAELIHDELNKVGFPVVNRVVNPRPESGMFSSIQCAAGWENWNPDLTHWVITLGDQPHLRETTLQTLLDFSARNPEKICQPIRSERRKHPVVLPKKSFEKLKHTTATDLKIFLTENAPDLSGFESKDAELDLDMDTPEDYERVRSLALAYG